MNKRHRFLPVPKLTLSRLIFIGLVLVNILFFPRLAQASAIPTGRDPIWNANSSDAPAYLHMYDNSQDLYSEYDLATLAGHLINSGVVDAQGCPNGGLQPDRQANDCGLRRAISVSRLWQNRYNASILAASRQTGVPPILLKNIFVWESQFWPQTVYINTSEFGLGHMTQMGADSLLRWNYPFYVSFCKVNLSSDLCKDKVYVEQPDYLQSMLRGLVIQQVNVDCTNCTYSLDLTRAENSIPIFANTLVANANLVKHYIKFYTGADTVSNLKYQDLWDFALTSYNAGPGCFKTALSKTVYANLSITWKNLSSKLDPGCKGSIAYVNFISQTNNYKPQDDPSLNPTVQPTVSVPTSTLAPTQTIPVQTPTPTAIQIGITATPVSGTPSVQPSATNSPSTSETPGPTATAQASATTEMPTVISTETSVVISSPTISASPTDVTPTTPPKSQPTATQSVKDILKPLHVENELVVKFDPQKRSTVLQTLVSMNMSVDQDLTHNQASDTLVIKVDPKNLGVALTKLRSDPGVEFAEPNYLVLASGLPADASQPNDPLFPSQNYLQAIQVPQAWNAIPSLQPVTVAILDTGLDTSQPDLINSIWQNSTEMVGSTGVDDDKNGYIDDLHGWNFVDGNNNIMDDNGHGTHLAGIIGAVTNNKVGVAGIAPNARIMPVKVLDKNGYGTYANVANGIVYATDNGARIIELGFGGTGSSELMQTAIDYALAHNVLVVSAAGNGGNDTTAYYPAAYTGVIAVSALDHNNVLASFSSSGPYVSLSAPGVGIISTGLSGTYPSMSGTSMSSAEVAGVAALLAGESQFSDMYDLRSALYGSTLDLGSAGRDPQYGYGMVQALSALKYAGPVVPVPTSTGGGDFPPAGGVKTMNTPPTVAITAPTGNLTFTQGTAVTFTGTALDAQDGDISAGISWYSNLEGPVGVGASISLSNLIPGTHVITAEATDSGGATGNASITILITPLQGPHGGASFANGATDQCALCHRTHSAQGDTYLTTNPNSVLTSDAFCRTCHNDVSTHSNKNLGWAEEQPFETRCIQCHDPHGSDNLFDVLKNIVTDVNTQTTAGPVTFTSLTGTNSFDDGTSSNALCLTCHKSTTYHNGGLNHRGGYDYTGQSCITCHPHNADNNPATLDGFMPVRGACNSCHGAPPADGAHLAHSAMAGAGTYGKVGVFNTTTQYVFGCGECHPTDASKHMNGVVEVDLNPATAPATSLKTMNAPTAAYNPAAGTCSGSYCHSGTQVTSSAVGNPTGLDSHDNLTYDPYTVTRTRVFATTPNWSTGHVSGTCTDCHQFPLTTAYPTVQAGVGDDHQWIDDYGYGNLHAYNMGFTPLQCSTCHYGEITQNSVTSVNGMDIATYGAVPVADRTLHVNGKNDVIFTTSPITYRTRSAGIVTFNLSTALYDPVKVACGNVGCHLSQNYVVWGTPYRWWNSQECDLCHRYSLPIPPPLTSMGLNSAPSLFNRHDPPLPPGSQCTTCHSNPHP